jgi:hypothetical protein
MRTECRQHGTARVASARAGLRVHPPRT